MSKRLTYSIAAILLILAVYGYDHFLNESHKKESIRIGSQAKSGTKSFFLPTSTTGQIVHHQYYSLSYSEPHEQAEWVAYELKKEHLKDYDFERPYFEIDPAVKTGSAHWRNYKNSGYDRGHLCPAGDRDFSESAFKETFLTSNIAPQKHDFNAGIWNRLEQKVRYWASKHDGVFVITGGILHDKLPSIGNENVAIPQHFYKVVLDYNNGAPKMIGFLIPHKDTNLSLKRFEVTVDSIEAMTGINFFESLDDTIEAGLESTLNYSKW